MVLLLLPSLTMAVRIWRVEMKYAFSEAADMARYINASHLDQARIAVHKPMSSVLPYLPRRTFWYPAMGEEGSHMRWDINWANGWRMPMDEAVRRMKEQCPDWQDPADPVLLLLSEALPDPQKDGVRLVYRTPGRAWGPSDEQFHLYAPAAFSPPSSSMRPGAPVCRHTPPRDILGHTRCPDGRIPCLK
jgi:hypothetical protein